MRFLMLIILSLPLSAFAAGNITITCPTKEQIASASKTSGQVSYQGARLFVTTIKINKGLAWVSYYQDVNSLNNLQSNSTISTQKKGPKLQMVTCTYGQINIVTGVSLPNPNYQCEPGANKRSIICKA